MAAAAAWAPDRRTVRPDFRSMLASALATIPAKVLARATSRSLKAAQHWKAGDNTPDAESLVRLAAEFDEVWQAVRASACRTEADAEAILDDIRSRLAARPAR